jgi:hypothetical protein
MDDFRKSVWIMGQSLDIPIMAFLGYFLFNSIGQQPAVGAMMGTLFGTFLLWISILATEGVFKKSKR